MAKKGPKDQEILDRIAILQARENFLSEQLDMVIAEKIALKRRLKD